MVHLTNEEFIALYVGFSVVEEENQKLHDVLSEYTSICDKSRLLTEKEMIHEILGLIKRTREVYSRSGKGTHREIILIEGFAIAAHHHPGIIDATKTKYPEITEVFGGIQRSYKSKLYKSKQAQPS